MFTSTTYSQDSQETYVTKYKNMHKRLVEFLRKSESRGYKIAWVNSIRIAKSIDLLKFYTVF